MKNKSLKKNAILSGIQKIFSIIFPVITFPYITRILQVEFIGQVNFAKSIISYFVLIAGLGITNYAVREGSRIKDNKNELEKFCNEIFSINMCSTIFAYILLIVLYYTWPKMEQYTFILLIESITIIGGTIGINWLYSIFEEYGYITIRTIIFQLISLILMFLFVNNTKDGMVYVWITVLSSVGANIFNLVHSRKYIHLKFTNKLNLKRHIKPILVIFASSIAISIYVNSDITILGWLKSDYNVGIYSVSVKVYSIMKQLVASMVIVALPRVSDYLSKERFEEYKNVISSLFSFLFTFTIPIGIGLSTISKNVIIIISGNSYIQATTSLKILSFSLIFAVFSSFITYAVILSNKYDKLQLVATIVSAIVNIGMNFIIIPIFAENGAAFTTLIAEILVLVIELGGFKLLNNEKKFSNMFFLKWNTVISTIIGSVCIIAITYIISIFRFSNIIELILDITISAIFYILICVAFKNEGLNFIKKNT